VLTAGALVLANGGVCYLDEFDKIPQEVHGSLHGPMEQGIVETSKMGAVNQRLPSRTAVFGAMNPKGGRFENFDSAYISQIDLDAAMLSRFDLIFAVRDIVDKDKDRHISHHMHETLHGSCAEGTLNSDFLRKYIHHSHQIKPVISKEVYEYITDLFVKVRVSQESDGMKLTNITFRQNDSLRRLAEASARSRLSSDVSVDDVDRAWRVFKGSLESLGVTDMDEFTVGWSDQARRILREMEPVLPCGYQGLRDMGFFEKDIELLKSKNVIFEKGGMFYRKKERL